MVQKQLNVVTLAEEDAVYSRYSDAARAVEPALCCPVEYSPNLLEAIPSEILERDYGCGDPTPYVCPGDTVLDLGSGAGKLCFIASQLVGSAGRVIGVDCNASMMALANSAAPVVAERVGYANVEFRCGLIQDLKLDLALLEGELAVRPVRGATDYLKLRNIEEDLRRERPLIADNSIDCVLSNCVLNLVRTRDRRQLFSEIFRVLKRGGRAAISDIVSDESVPEHMRANPELWSGCISGAFREDEFLSAFEDAGFHGMRIAKRESAPWRVVDGIEFRSVTVLATKGKQGPCLDHNQAVIYRGPFKKVEDDDGNSYYRGERMAVCEKTFQLLQRAPYEEMFIGIAPRVAVPVGEAKPFDCSRNMRRDPKETKGATSGEVAEIQIACSQGDACC